ncbi:hypothetical protein [Peribacillus sp. FSL R5-0717]|uniref:hypothetical protein n=1 Tax=Peribacillus sp. FSL R5-0717 TaxID=2975308 RepID=UPI0030F51236
MGKEHGHVNWMDQIFKEYEREGGLKNNPGFGKPLMESALSGNIYDHFLTKAKDAGFLALDKMAKRNSRKASRIGSIEKNEWN